ncbi:hypothetical protein Acr_29g0007920 [Actinidia rufa]|uniref:Uncharacterized protein n=1 Tax=Actinidia rufa TaxID=165716 RepID=A0A7J0HES6_9ERIC|nr:hypothetical protein Acr_29g0007920 [Actinidia rufa]
MTAKGRVSHRDNNGRRRGRRWQREGDGIGNDDDMLFEVRLNDEKDLGHQDKLKISQDLKLFLQPVREKLLQLEQELKDR